MKIKRIGQAFAVLLAAFSLPSCKKVDESPHNLELPEVTTITTVEHLTEAVPAAVNITETPVTETEASPRIVVPKTEFDSLEWDREFMENTIFVGDSVCRALYVYNDLLTTKQVAAVGGGAARNIYDYTFKMEDNEFDLKQAVEYYKPEVVFLWMGINDINMTEKDVYAENLKSIADDVISRSPESKVVILSMSPTADYHEWNANERIREYNAAAMEMCGKITDKEIYYLDIQDILSDTDGYLLPECDGGDGMHLSEMAYIRLLSYITAVKDGFMPSEETASETAVTADSQALLITENITEETSAE